MWLSTIAKIYFLLIQRTDFYFTLWNVEVNYIFYDMNALEIGEPDQY